MVLPGACEPEPHLDMGWFTAPSKRGILMHAKVYWRLHTGEEEIMKKTPLFTEINVTSNYAPTQTYRDNRTRCRQ